MLFEFLLIELPCSEVLLDCDPYWKHNIELYLTNFFLCDFTNLWKTFFFINDILKMLFRRRLLCWLDFLLCGFLCFLASCCSGRCCAALLFLGRFFLCDSYVYNGAADAS